jgi:hypothetical protein
MTFDKTIRKRNTQFNNIRHNNKKTQHRINSLNVYAECCIKSFMLSVIRVTVVMLNVVASFNKSNGLVADRTSQQNPD